MTVSIEANVALRLPSPPILLLLIRNDNFVLLENHRHEKPLILLLPRKNNTQGHNKLKKQSVHNSLLIKTRSKIVPMIQDTFAKDDDQRLQ